MNSSVILWLGNIPYDFTDKDGRHMVGSSIKAVLITRDSRGNEVPEIVKVSPQHSLKCGMEGVCYYDKHGRLVDMG